MIRIPTSVAAATRLPRLLTGSNEQPVSSTGWTALLAGFCDTDVNRSSPGPAPDEIASGGALSEASKRDFDHVLLTLDEVAAGLQMSVKSVQRRIKAGVIRTVPLGGRLVRISADELRRLAASDVITDIPKDPDVS